MLRSINVFQNHTISIFITIDKSIHPISSIVQQFDVWIFTQRKFLLPLLGLVCTVWILEMCFEPHTELQYVITGRTQELYCIILYLEIVIEFGLGLNVIFQSLFHWKALSCNVWSFFSELLIKQYHQQTTNSYNIVQHLHQTNEGKSLI